MGTGDPGDMTLNALRAIEKCKVIAVPVTGNGRSAALDIASRAADLSEKEILRLKMPMVRDREQLTAAHRAAAEALCKVLEKKDAAMLCLGDISLYSTFSYISALVKERGADVKCISGVCSPCAAANALGIPLALGDEPLMILPGGAEEFSQLIRLPCRKVIMKSGSSAGYVKKVLRENGLLEKTRAVENCGTVGERTYSGEDIPEDPGYFTIYLV